MARDYPLHIQNIGEDVYTLISKGHHDPHVFMAKVREEGWSWPLGMPQHIWFRAIPTRKPYYICLYVEAVAGSRGAWPATLTTEAWGEDSYEARAGLPAAAAQHIEQAAATPAAPGNSQDERQ
jgi:hypothetical protein